ncbi:hypothetical protein B9Q04_20215 [Candidatus Marsarchaeota G2 archaeon BE_D]|uniref:Uncharacterized protein n=2 Tax=Candidatus Marsarchaeota group 2 TaxID=2203771 RepID=A0A2R6BWA3_9ARCH|nr:MAG: hypothetical protein B9Q04_20215 [Candidatus Marsarchaeota G2 archaeon BE_D]
MPAARWGALKLANSFSLNTSSESIDRNQQGWAWSGGMVNQPYIRTRPRPTSLNAAKHTNQFGELQTVNDMWIRLRRSGRHALDSVRTYRGLHPVDIFEFFRKLNVLVGNKRSSISKSRTTLIYGSFLYDIHSMVSG